jgi:hypothetical protein
MNITSGINWIKLAIVLVLMSSVFGLTALAQTNSEKPLNAEAVAALIEELTDGLPDLIEDEDQAAAITEKWDARENLAGKTRTQILGLLFADVRSVVRDAETQKNIWDTWTGAADETEAEEDEEDWSTMDDSRKLNAQNVLWMLNDFEDELHDFLDNQAQIAAIVKKWHARKDLAGKTKADVTALLYTDVKSVVKDKETLDDIEDSWKVSDAISNPSATKQQQEALDELKKHIFEEAENNMDIWKQVFLMLKFGGAADYDPEAVAGFYLMREGTTPAEAWVKSLEGIVAFQKLQNRNLLPAELEQVKEMTVKLMGCGSNCAAEHKKLKEHAAQIVQTFKQVGIMITFIIKLTDKQNMETFLKSFVQAAYKEYQSMENYDPYKIEAECRENGGDEVGCFKTTYFGLFGYALFGKQADEKVHIDKKSLDLVNRWKNERLAKFQCLNADCTEVKIKP